jgi:hypothetical protein
MRWCIRGHQQGVPNGIWGEARVRSSPQTYLDNHYHWCQLFAFRYQKLAIEARDIWLSWNKEISESSPADLPAGLSPEDKLLHICGSYFLAEGMKLNDFYSDSLAMMEKTAPDFRKMQFVKVHTPVPLYIWILLANELNYNRATLKKKSVFERLIQSGLTNTMLLTRSMTATRMDSLISMVASQSQTR